MGVWALETFIQKDVKNGVHSVSIAQELIDFQKVAGQKPIIIFDVMSLIGLICQDVEVTLCGGRYLMYTTKLETLFRALSGAELIFFMDGLVRDYKRITWAKRQTHRYVDSLLIMDQIYEGRMLRDIRESFRYKPIHIGVIEEACKKFGKLYYAVDFECDQEIARFAFMNKRVFGIFSNDSDFLIFRGDWRYFSTKDLKLTTLKTKEFDRKALRKHLKLKEFELQIFATIAGNDFITHEELKKFQSSFCSQGNKFLGIANYVRNKSKMAESRNLLLKLLSKDIFGNTKQEQLTRLQRSIDFYNVHNDIEPSHDDLLAKHNLFTYNVLNKSPFSFSLAFFDFRCIDMPSYYELCVPMLQRQAGVVFLMSQTPDAHITVYMKTSHCGNHEKFQLPPIIPPIEVPFLEDLYGDDPMYDGLRHTLLKWTIDYEKLKFFYIEDFPENYMIDILTITFMTQRGVISPKEADVFLWVIKNVENRTIPTGLKPPAILRHRPFRLAFLFVKIFSNVARSIEVCGLKKKYWKPCNFDGVFFHHEYERFSYQPFDTNLLLNEL